MDKETWHEIKGYEGLYAVSDRLRVKGLERTIPHAHSGYLTIQERIISQRPNPKNGYIYVMLYKQGKGQNKTLHRLLAEAFIPNPDDLPFVLHADDNPGNNDLSNLRWGTRSENGKDAVGNGRNKNSNKSDCLRGHRLEQPNLVTGMLPYRSCKACSYERVRARSENREFDPKLADKHYERILLEQGKEYQ